MPTAPAPKDKLDTGAAPAVKAVGAGVVNGPEGGRVDWNAVNWRAVDADVRRLRQRIFAASQAGDLKRVRSLQKLMLRSRANTLASVRQVTERNGGRNTAGVDGELAVTATEKAKLVAGVHQDTPSQDARPVKRVYIPKADGKQRPLGIPVIVDRVQQGRVKNALEPEWEARFEPLSYGFRPGRSCQDAIAAIFKVVARKNAHRLWALDADLTAAFDHIDHDYLLARLGSFPGREMVRRWLRAGVIDRDGFLPTRQGVPQGGVISPLLLNIALHGLEEAAGVRYRVCGSHAAQTVPDTPVLVRYADDLIALCVSRAQAEQVQARLAQALTLRGLTFNEDKTRIVHLTDGFDFLGFNVRRYGTKPLIKPSTQAVKRIRERLAAEMWSLRGTNAMAVIRTLNPIIQGWAAYYRSVVSSQTFRKLEHYVWKLTYKWAKRAHPKKPKRWIAQRYFGRFNKARQDRWVFGDRDSGFYLQKFAWTRIIRHQMVTGTASLDDPALTDYWAMRRRKDTPLGKNMLPLLHKQQGKCPLCGSLLLNADHEPQSPDAWEQWIRGVRTVFQHADRTGQGGSGEKHPYLVHTLCQQRHTAAHSKRHQHLSA